jgi:superfamily II DNA or RNA helicase
MNNFDRVLTAHGYAIKKTSLTPKSTQSLRKNLTVQPIVNQKFAGGSGPAFCVYTESPTRFYVPRAWALDHFGPAEAESISEGDRLRSELVFTGTPYDYQKGIVDQYIDSGANGLICVPCGRGKTFMAIWTALRIGRRFLIVVDKEFLMNQWRGELEALVPGLRIGIIQEDKVQVLQETRLPPQPTIPELKTRCKELGLKVGGRKQDLLDSIQAATGKSAIPEPETIEFDCTIAMIQTLVQREFEPETFKAFGFTIFDECHHLGAAHFSRALLKVQTKKMLGLSATPIRDDGLTKVFEWFLGKPVYWEKTREPDPTVIVRGEIFSTKDVKYNEVPTDYRGEMIMARLLTNILECDERNARIVEIIHEIIQKEPTRRVLVLSERIGHLNDLEERLKLHGYTMSYYIGGMKEDVRETGAKDAQILLASYAMASEAMNIKSLNTVILASPRKKVEQSTGRILRVRPEHRTVAPLIVDIVDSHGCYLGQWKKRLTYYKKCAYKILRSDDDEDHTEEAIVEDTGCLIEDD